MTSDEIEAFFADRNKHLPASPSWREHKSRAGEMRARLAIESRGLVSRVEIEMTVRAAAADYLVVVLIAPQCIARMCIGPDTEHNNRITGERITGPHYHDWGMNKHLPKREGASLPYCVSLPSGISDRDAAFAWFLQQIGVESPGWMPVKWPAQGGLF